MDRPVAGSAAGVFLDSTRAGGATVVAAYSPRVRPGVPVSFPVSWDDLDHIVPADFTIRNAAARLAGADPWQQQMPEPQPLPADLVEGHTIPIARVQAMHEASAAPAPVGASSRFPIGPATYTLTPAQRASPARLSVRRASCAASVAIVSCSDVWYRTCCGAAAAAVTARLHRRWREPRREPAGGALGRISPRRTCSRADEYRG